MVHRNGRIGWSLIVVLVCVLAGEAVMVPAVLAEEPAIEVNSQEAVRQTLESQAGQSTPADPMATPTWSGWEACTRRG